jgi:hypothetical protein
LSSEELVETIFSGNMFIKELVQYNIRSLTIDNLTERKMGIDLCEPKLVQMGDSNMLKR